MRALPIGGLVCFLLLVGCGSPEVEVAAPPEPLTVEARARIRSVLASADPDEVKAALAEIARAAPSIPWLLEGLLDSNRGVREWSAHALGDLAPQDDGVVRALVVSFEDKDDYVRWKAARALGNIGPRAAMALPLLRVAAETETEVLQAASQKAVRQISGD